MRSLAMAGGSARALLEEANHLSRRRPIGSLPTINSNMVPADAPYESSTPRLYVECLDNLARSSSTCKISSARRGSCASGVPEKKLYQISRLCRSLGQVIEGVATDALDSSCRVAGPPDRLDLVRRDGFPSIFCGQPRCSSSSTGGSLIIIILARAYSDISGLIKPQLNSWR